MMDEFKISKRLSNGDFYIVNLLVGGALFLLIGTIVQVIAFQVFEIRTPGFVEELMRYYEKGLYDKFTDDMWFSFILPLFLRNFLLAIIFILLLRKALFWDLKRFKTDFLSNIAGIIIGMVFILVLTVLANNIYELIGIEDTSANQASIVSGFKGKYAYLMFASVLIAPFVEEILFRKFIYGLIEEKFKWPWWSSVIISAVIFAAIHDTSVFFFQYFFTSLVLCLSYSLFKKNIWVPIGIHFLNNSLPLLALALGIII